MKNKKVIKMDSRNIAVKLYDFFYLNLMEGIRDEFY